MKMKRISHLIFIAMICTSGLRAWGDGEPDGVTVKDNQVYAMYGDKLEMLTENLKLPFGVEVYTNGYFKVGDGKKRELMDGEVIRRDGWLVEPSGSVQPVYNHVAMIKGQVYVVRDGEANVIKGTMVFSNGMSLNSGGYGDNLPGGNLRLADGQLFQMNGTPIPAMDSASLKNGQVVVQRDGSLITLSSNEIMGMDDGSRVYGDGTIQKRDSSTFKLHKGQTILIPGAVYSR